MPQDPFRARLRRQVAAVALFAVLSLAWSFPLVLHLGTHVPGESAGDNLGFVWNLWWMRTALHAHLSPFHTTYLFHPIGADLTQHTLTPLAGVVAATALSPLSLPAAQNVLILVSLFLNGFLAYLLALRLTRGVQDAGDGARRYAALLAGIAFGGAAPVLIRLYGHFNLVAAWVIPFAILLFVRAFERRSATAVALAGLGLAVVAYSEYYYLIYCAVFLVMWLGGRWWEWRLIVRRRPPDAISRTLVALAALDLVLIVGVWVSGGFSVRAGGVLVSMHETFNLRAALWLLLGAWALSRRPVSVSGARRPGADVRRDLAIACGVVATFVVAASPIVIAAARLLLRGEYASQRYFWRSAPPGIDIATLFLGHPLHALYGPLTRSAYTALHLNTVEGVGWVGSVALVVLAWSWRRLRTESATWPWRAAIVAFGVWALGPWLNAFGANLALPLPSILLRFVPLASNARMPGRAMVMVSLAAAMLLSFVLSRAAVGWSRPRRALVAGLLLLDVAAGPIPLYRVEMSGVYASLRRQPAPGAVLELPLGIRDGFGETGRFDARALYFQTVSERPIVGGFVARLPERVKAWYRQAPVIGTVLRLSDPNCPPAWQPAALSSHEVYDALVANSIAYVVVDRDSAAPRLVAYLSSWPLDLVAADNSRDLYAVRKP